MKLRTKTLTTVSAAVLMQFCLLSASPVMASGFDNLGIGSMDMLFDPAKFALEFGATYVNRNVNYKAANPRRKTDLTHVGQNPIVGEWRPLSALQGPTEALATPDVWNYTVNAKAALNDNINCLLRMNNPGTISEQLPEGWLGRLSLIETQLTTFGIDTTCSYKIEVMAGGFFHLIGGGRYIEADLFSYKLSQNGEARATLDSSGYGWRAGAAFEYPEYAIRASVFYDSAIDMEFEGDLVVALNTFPMVSQVTMPQGVEVRVQSGIAPKWLAFVGVKWVDWSVLSELRLDTPEGNDATVSAVRTFNFSDGWTVTAGIGHQLTEKIQVGSSLTWDKGIGGSYSDTYQWGLGGAYDLTENIKFSLGGAVIYKVGAKDAYNPGYSSNQLPPPFPQIEDYDDIDLSYDASWNFAVGSKLKIHF